MKKILITIKYFYFSIYQAYKNWKRYNNSEYELDRLDFKLLVHTHSIEKGLSIEKPRLGFGHAKQQEMMEWITKLQKSDSKFYAETIQMAVASLWAYLKYHEIHNYKDEFIEKICAFLELNQYDDTEQKLGGVQKIKKKDMHFNIEDVEKMFTTRHSIRDFADSEVEMARIEKAIRLAQSCPSACNRQGVRTYIVHSKKADALKTWLTGIGGFEDTVKEFILITGKLSAYKPDDYYQYVVSASIFAAYLSLTLHTYGLGACIIQRAVVWTEEWEEIQKKYKIPLDEQAICVLGVGNLKDEFSVPVSHRFDIQNISTWI